MLPGLTRNCAPAAAARRARPADRIVPAPTSNSGTSAAIRRTASSADGVRRVSSMIGRPPAASARASGTACVASSRTTTGTTGATSNSALMRPLAEVLSPRAVDATLAAP